MEKFDWKNFSNGTDNIIRRIIKQVGAPGWKNSVRLLQRTGKPFPDLCTLEIGCGSGTFSQSLALLGARTVLVDCDEEALKTAEKIYSLLGLKGRFINRDVLNGDFSDMKNSFDMVISGGLAEHFQGQERERCIRVHREMLNAGGFAYIGVPNKLSPFYWLVRIIRTLTGRWDIEMEKPYTFYELKKLAEKSGFFSYEVKGNYSLSEDAVEYTLGAISALAALFPGIREIFQAMRKGKKKTAGSCEDINREQILSSQLKQVKKIIENSIGRTDIEDREAERFAPKDVFSAGIILFGFAGDKRSVK